MSSCPRLSEGASYLIQPLKDSRWNELLKKHPRATIFHTSEWLTALRLTYGHEPCVVTTSPPGTELQNGIVYCRVSSWVTGRRLVSVPSSDHCEPLLESPADLDVLLHSMENQMRESHSEYIDLRTSSAIAFPTALTCSTQDFCFHQLDLRPPLETLLRNCHSSSTQRKIRRAGREGLTCESGHTDLLLKTFLKLYALTRRRHQIPPQPKQWFRNLINCFKDDLKIRIAYKNGQPVAATLAIRYKDTIVYKYGCSDSRFNNLGGTQFLFWKMIEESKKEGLLWLDLGRSDLQNTGLITFKDRLGAAKSRLTYSRFAVSKKPILVYTLSSEIWKERLDKYLLAQLPDRALYFVGSLLYPHVG